MFHVEQSDFRRRFHVKRELPKTHCLVGFWRLFTRKIGIFVLSPCKISQQKFRSFTRIFSLVLFRNFSIKIYPFHNISILWFAVCFSVVLI